MPKTRIWAVVELRYGGEVFNYGPFKTKADAIRVERRLKPTLRRDTADEVVVVEMLADTDIR